MPNTNLTHEQQQLFANVHERHMAAMGAEAIAKYGKVTKATWDQKEGAIKAQYENGSYWYYTPGGKWY